MTVFGWTEDIPWAIGVKCSKRAPWGGSSTDGRLLQDLAIGQVSKLNGLLSPVPLQETIPQSPQGLILPLSCECYVALVYPVTVRDVCRSTVGMIFTTARPGNVKLGRKRQAVDGKQMRGKDLVSCNNFTETTLR